MKHNQSQGLGGFSSFYSGVCLHKDEQVVEGLGLSGANWVLGCVVVVVVDLEAGACGGGRSRAGGA